MFVILGVFLPRRRRLARKPVFLAFLVALGKHRNFGQTNVRVSPRKSASECLILPIDRIWPAERRAMRRKPENSAQSDISAALIALRAT